MIWGSPVLYRDHQMGPGGPPGGATHPGGPRGLKWGGNQPIVGWCAPPWASPLRLGLETLGQGAPHLPWGARPPPGPPPPLGDGSPGPAPPLGGLYKGGREGSHTLQP